MKQKCSTTECSQKGFLIIPKWLWSGINNHPFLPNKKSCCVSQVPNFIDISFFCQHINPNDVNKLQRFTLAIFGYCFQIMLCKKMQPKCPGNSTLYKLLQCSGFLPTLLDLMLNAASILRKVKPWNYGCLFMIKDGWPTRSRIHRTLLTYAVGLIRSHDIQYPT